MHCFFVFREKLTYLFKRKGPHGLHSPYLFHLLTHTFSKAVDAKEIKDFQTHLPGIQRRNARQFLQLTQRNSCSRPQQIPLKLSTYFDFGDDLYYFHSIADFEVYHKLESNIPNERIHFINGIRNNAVTLEKWSTLSNDFGYHVSIDLFNAGILIRRMHQQKENFVL
jgi:hypothetical protein